MMQHSGTTDIREHLMGPSKKVLSSPAQIDPFYSQGYACIQNLKVKIYFLFCSFFFCSRDNISTNEVLDECCITAFGYVCV